jgi:hypothetical protein
MEVALLITRIALAVLLYAFLGAVVILLWRDVRYAAISQAAPADRERPARLVVVEGSNGLEGDSVFTLKPYTSIGRAPSNTIELADTYCSAEHALIVWRNGHWWIEDRDSRNGTLLNDVSVETAVVLSTGDVLRLGRVRMRFEMDES